MYPPAVVRLSVPPGPTFVTLFSIVMFPVPVVKLKNPPEGKLKAPVVIVFADPVATDKLVVRGLPPIFVPMTSAYVLLVSPIVSYELVLLVETPVVVVNVPKLRFNVGAVICSVEPDIYPPAVMRLSVPAVPTFRAPPMVISPVPAVKLNDPLEVKLKAPVVIVFADPVVTDKPVVPPDAVPTVSV